MRSINALGALLVMSSSVVVHAEMLTFNFDTYNESKTFLGQLEATRSFRLDGLVPDRGGSPPLVQSMTFRAGSTDLSMSAGWRTMPIDVRTIGVNIDLFDSANNLVSTDTFDALVGGLAQSHFVASGLTLGGLYTLQLTGSAAQAARYQIDLVSGTTPPATPPTPIIDASPASSLFDTLTGNKDYGFFAPGATLLLDGILSETGAITNSAMIKLTGNTLSAGITWVIGALGTPQRTVGVNFDIFDSNGDLVGTDTFLGLTDGQAFSSFALTGLSAGDYTLKFTGTAQDGGRYRINLGTNATAPGMVRIPTAVPEPESWALLLSGFACIGFVMRRGRNRYLGVRDAPLAIAA